MENSRTPINSSEEATLDHLEQYLEMAGDDEILTQYVKEALRAVYT